MITTKQYKDIQQSFTILENTIDDYEKRGGDPYYPTLALNMIKDIVIKNIVKELIKNQQDQ